jgi:general L-amino acid transport system permease protein
MKSTWFQGLRQRLFATPVDAAITLVCLYIVWRISVPLVQWALLDATWNGTGREACKADGACWVFIRARFGQFMYGQYPGPERWRVDLVGALCVAAGLLLSWRGLPQRGRITIATAIVVPAIGILLLHGGWGTGLRLVETREWGGLMLTVFITIYAGLIAVPLGILLALGRRSRLPLIRFASVVFIEFWRGVPIITVIFLASLLLPLIMPAGFDVDRLARAILGLAFVIAAYMAEAVRGGLQALPEGQAEAAQALGLGRAPGLLAHTAHDRAAAGAQDRAARDDQRIHRFVQEHDARADRLAVRPAGHRAGSTCRSGVGGHEHGSLRLRRRHLLVHLFCDVAMEPAEGKAAAGGVRPLKAAKAADSCRAGISTAICMGYGPPLCVG